MIYFIFNVKFIYNPSRIKVENKRKMKENNLFLKCLTNGIVTHIINVVRN